VQPTSGPLAGGFRVTITGINFDHRILFVGLAAVETIMVSIEPNQVVTLAQPAKNARSGEALIIAPASGVTQTDSRHFFTYNPPQRITAVAPTHIPSEGGTQVTVTGTGLVPSFGDPELVALLCNVVVPIVSVSPTTVVVRSMPAASHGPCDISIQSVRSGTTTVTAAVTVNPRTCLPSGLFTPYVLPSPGNSELVGGQRS
jgi:hypothetical protein